MSLQELDKEKGEVQIVRAAGLLERLHISRQRLNLGACVLTAAQFVFSPTSPLPSGDTPDSLAIRKDTRNLNREEFYHAVTHAINVHPALAVRIHNEIEGREPASLVRMSSIDLDKGVQFLPPAQSVEGSLNPRGVEVDIENALLIQFDTSSNDAPLWRFTVTPSNLVIFVYHHVLGDGQSGLAVLQTVLQALNEATLQRNHNAKVDDGSTNLDSGRYVTPPLKLDFLPCLESRIDCSYTLRGLFGALLGELLPSWTKRRIWTGNNVLENVPTPPKRIKTSVRVVSLPADAASRFLTRCRSRKTTITSVMHLTAVIVLSHLITTSHDRHTTLTTSDTHDRNDITQSNNSKPHQRKYKKLHTHLAISLRSLANIPPSTMYETASSCSCITPFLLPELLTFPCCHPTEDPNTELDPSFDWEGNFPWSKASKFSETLRKAAPQARATLGLLKFLNGKFEPFWRGKLGKKRDSGLELSNVGAWIIGDSNSKKRGEVGDKEGDKDAIRDEGEEEEQGWNISSAYFAQDDNVVGAALKMNVIGSPNGELNMCVTWGEGAVDEPFAEAFARGLRHGLVELSR